MEEFDSVGKCVFCNAEFGKAGISRHLNTHLAQQVKVLPAGTSFHVRVESEYKGAPYFLNLWVDGTVLMDEIDIFLRRIWLDCCGHMSAFSIPKQKGRIFIFDDDDSDEEDEIMATATKDILQKGLKLKYSYDFGSTTSLMLTVQQQLPVAAPHSIVLLSRNEPLEIMCDTCRKEPAALICAVCYNDNAFCKKCAKAHAKTCEDFADYSSLPVVNSPRMGVCAYDGGTIDKQRDGAFVKKKVK